jgi:metal-dependent HD superfamily phosphatase/phosphodiesterase
MSRTSFHESTIYSPRRIDVHIDDLVLHGFERGDHQRIGAAIEAEIARLLTEQGLPFASARDRSVEFVDAGQFNMTKTKPETIGNQVAQRIHAGLSIKSK